MNTLTSNNKRFWLFTCLAIIGYGLLFIFTNRINNLDELHYLSLAWEMHKQHHYLLPMALGHPDIQKPPLLYWLINAGWSLFGINTGWPLMLIALINLGCLYTTWCIAKKLFPEKILIAQLAVIILATGVFWFHFFNRIRFDGLLTLCTILYINYTINIYRERHFIWTLLAGVTLGLGFLAKGGAILIFALPFYLLLPRYEKTTYPYLRWLGQFLVTLLIGLSVVAAWAIPLYLSLGKHTIETMFVSQQHSRILFTHHLGELPNLFISFLPWTVMPMLFLNFGKLRNLPRSHFGLLNWTILLSGLFFTFFVLMHVKRYLLPLYPLVAITLSYIINLRITTTTLLMQNRILLWMTLLFGCGLIFIGVCPLNIITKILPPSSLYAAWGVGLLIVSVMGWWFTKRLNHNPLLTLTGLICALLISGIIGVNGLFTTYNDLILTKLTMMIKHNQQLHIPQANLISGGYQAFDFKGQLEQPLPLFDENSTSFKSWLKQNPNGVLYFSMRKHVRPCMAQHAYYLKGSDRIIAVINTHNYLTHCI